MHASLVIKVSVMFHVLLHSSRFLLICSAVRMVSQSRLRYCAPRNITKHQLRIMKFYFLFGKKSGAILLYALEGGLRSHVLLRVVRMVESTLIEIVQ